MSVNEDELRKIGIGYQKLERTINLLANIVPILADRALELREEIARIQERVAREKSKSEKKA